MIVSISGDVRCATSQPAILKTGTILASKDSLFLGEKATITILEEDGKVTTYSQSFRLASKSECNPTLQKLLKQGIQSQNWIESAKKKPRNNFRSNTTDNISMVYPRNTRLTKLPERLNWTVLTKSESEYEVSIRCYENDFSYDHTTGNNSLDISSDISLSIGQQYYWFVRDVFSELSEVPSAVWFNVLDTKEIKKLEQERQTVAFIMNNDTLSVAYQMLFANLLMSYELYDECKSLLDDLSKQDGQNHLLHTFYAIIYDKMDLISDSRKYIEYTDQYSK
ncbi:hypothetical protein F9K33_01070 [bacterium]|nr:MAG: hypothetical protein F9K33_01070 [bacterium]